MRRKRSSRCRKILPRFAGGGKNVILVIPYCAKVPLRVVIGGIDSRRSRRVGLEIRFQSYAPDVAVCRSHFRLNVQGSQSRKLLQISVELHVGYNHSPRASRFVLMHEMHRTVVAVTRHGRTFLSTVKNGRQSGQVAVVLDFVTAFPVGGGREPEAHDFARLVESRRRTLRNRQRFRIGHGRTCKRCHRQADAQKRRHHDDRQLQQATHAF
ncbi:unknown [Faecalibacterium sp. CAG:1138]|nr:unknown [Faecalibacterium sp. CAG:1138]